MTAPAARSFASTVLAAKDECRGVRTLRLSVPGDFSFIPGQWLMAAFPDEPKHARAYSIASSPLEKGFVELTMAGVGPLSERLCRLTGGETLLLKGPYGKWVLKEDAPHAVLISGGTGLTPLRAMARYALAQGAPRRLTILYSAKTPDDMLYREELDALAARGVKVHATVTRPAPGDGWRGPTGRLSISVIEREVAPLAGAWYFLCGPASLVRDLSGALAAKGVPREQIRTEMWGDY